MRTNRRSFLAVAGAGLSALALPGPFAAGATGGEPGSAGSGRGGIGLSAIGVQLFTVRALLQRDFDGTLARIAELGYREVELAGFHGRTAALVNSSLSRAGLSAPAGHVSMTALDDDWPQTIEDAQTLGQRFVVVASLDRGEPMTLDTYRRAADQFNLAGEIAAQAGIHLAYHNHDFEFAPLDGQVPYDLLLEATEPHLVGFEMDFYWVHRAGADPFSYFDRWPGRIKLAHLKDSAGAPRHAMADVGAGVIDWHAILRRREQAGMEHYFVERDDAPDPLNNIAASYRYLRTL